MSFILCEREAMTIMTNGYARLRDDPTMIACDCEAIARALRVKIIPYAQHRATRKCAIAQSITTTTVYVHNLIIWFIYNTMWFYGPQK